MKMTNIQGLLEKVKTFHEVELKIEVLNSRQCKNLLVNFQNGVEAIQSFIDGSYGWGVFHRVEQEMLGIMKKSMYMVEECCKVDDWCRVVVMQLNNKESFRELLLGFGNCFHTMCDIFRHTFPNREVEIQDIENTTTFYPASIDEVEQDQIAIFERLAREVDLCKIDNCKEHCMLLRYLMDRVRGLQKTAGCKLSDIILPSTCPSPESTWPPEPLGTGGYGSVYGTQWLGIDTATKVIKVDSLDHETLVWKEARILGGLNHPNIITFFCCGLLTKCDRRGTERKFFQIVMERGDMSLSKFLQQKKEPLAEEMAVDIIIQIASGMWYLHDMQVAHRDLKPDNVILTSLVGSNLEHLHVKLLDFGISKIDVKRSPQVPTNGGCFGTKGYMAPEAYSNRNLEVHAFKADVFSFGMTCYEILSNKRPGDAIKLGDYVKSIVENERPKLPETCSEGLKSLIRECWSSKPLARPTFLEICKKLEKLKSDAMLKVANDVGVAKILQESTTPNNSIEFPKQWWTMLTREFHGWRIVLLSWQLFVTFIQWLSRCLPKFLEKYTTSSASAQESSNITTPNQIPCEVTSRTNGIPKLIGLQGKILELEKRLQHIGSLGIVGMGGIGKSTLANALSDHISHQFDVTCFVGDFTYESCTIHVKYEAHDVKEPSQTKTFREGHEILRQLRKTKKILIVLDNVGKASQLEELLGNYIFPNVGGNELIATSRSWKSLERYVLAVGKVDMQTLDEDQSKELFSMHAFAANQPCLPYLEHVVEKIVKTCDGLPLSLEVMGSYLYGEKSLRVWEITLQTLSRARRDGRIDRRIWETLRISFDELSPKEKNMFLDITCFICKDSWFSDWNYTKKTLSRMFNDDVKITQQTLDSLQEKSLLKFEINGHLDVQDQLRDMGRMIVETGFQQTRVWNLSVGTFSKYWNQKRIALLEGLSFTTFERNFAFQTNVCVNTMKSLRFLSVQNCENIDILFYIISKTTTLKWLRIHFSTKHGEFFEQHKFFIEKFTIVAQDHLQQLGVLEFFKLTICKYWDFRNFYPIFLKELSFIDCSLPFKEFSIGLGSLIALEELKIVRCKDMEKLFILTRLTTLIKLNILECEALEEFPSGICSLRSLEELSFNGCKSLRNIPEGLGGLTCLRKLDMRKCEALEEFPSGICSLMSLEELSFSGCNSLRNIPEGLGGLTCLKKLHMWECEALEEFPSGICSLMSLEELSFSGCRSLRNIPEGFGGLTCLRKLCMRECEALEEFPSGICSLIRLEELSFNGCRSLRNIPEGFRGLTCLKKLHMWECEALEEFPFGICSLRSLEELSFNECRSLRNIPEGLRGLMCLRKLNMRECEALEEFPSGICSLMSLEELSFSGCKSLRNIPEGLGGLTCLKKLHMWECEALEEFPSVIRSLRSLEELSFSGCKSLRNIPEGFGGFTCLKKLHMWECEAMEEFPSGICSLRSLEELSFSGCRSLRNIPEGFGGLTCLRKLDMRECEALEEFPCGICSLIRLEELSFSGCRSLRNIPEGFGGLTCLRKLDMRECEALEEFPSGICSLIRLEELSFSGCRSLRNIPEGLGGLTCLKKLHMWECEVLEE